MVGMSCPVPAYVRYATLVEPGPKERPDGDTFRLRLDHGTYTGVKIDPVVDIRLKGIDVVELRSPMGMQARGFTLTALRSATQIVVATDKAVADVTFARTVAQVWVDGQDLAELLRGAGFEKPRPAA